MLTKTEARKRPRALTLQAYSWSPNVGTEKGMSSLRGIAFLLAVFFAFIRLGFYAASSPPDANTDRSWSNSFKSFYSRPINDDALISHPITRYMDDAEQAYRQKLSSQSLTLSAAVAEYKRRYKRNPPKGFDDWFLFAKANKVVMIDEYDGLLKDLEPFLDLSGVEVRRRAIQAAHLPDVDLVRIRNGALSMVHIEDGIATSQVSGRSAGFKAMLEPFASKLPDLDFPVNALSSGRVLVPWEIRKHPNLTLQDSSEGLEAMLGGPFVRDWRGEGNIWESWRRTCEPEKNARRLLSSIKSPFSPSSRDYLSRDGSTRPGNDFSFSHSGSLNLDFCEMPHAHYTQGHFFSDFRPINRLYPIFSPAKAQGFSDIRIPSHYYYGNTKRYTYAWDTINLELKDVDDMEMAWDRKSDLIYWRGASLGGGNSPPGFSSQYHRHRFVRMASELSTDINQTVTFANSPSESQFISTSVPVGALNEELMDVAFVTLHDEENYAGGIDAMENELRFSDSVALGKHWGYKYIVDLDGVGYSGRFLAFLASDSVPLKATVYEEFYSDWIQPWLHYIPLSTTYKEIYNIHAYFSGATQSTLEAANSTMQHLPQHLRKPSSGDARLRRIARAGKEWKQTVGRRVDIEAFVYRLCLEYARLSADDRDAMSYTP